MTNESTIEKLHRMKLSGMERAFREILDSGISRQYTQDEVIAHLVDSEWDERYNRKLNYLLKKAGFRYQASFESLDFNANRNLDKNDFLRFSNCDWIRKKENILITGATGVGKSYIASALGNLACKNGFKVIYFNAIKLFSKLKYSKADGSYTKEMNWILKQDLLILDDFGLDPLDNQSRLMLLEMIEDRHGNKSTIITSQLPVKNWFEVIGDPTIADAVCDRIIHTAHKIELMGVSMRKLYGNKKSSDQILDETCHLP
jgi:DNA replication protein DnaC